MKHTLLALFILFSSVFAQAQEQKHRVYADVGYVPGFSVTYNYQLSKRIAMGAGVQSYKLYSGLDKEAKYKPCVYADMRLVMRPEKKSQFLLFFDVGINIYKQDKTFMRDDVSVYNIPRNNGFYTGLGFGYLRRINKQGNALYITLKPMMNWHAIQRYYITTDEQNGPMIALNGQFPLSIGFKF